MAAMVDHVLTESPPATTKSLTAPSSSPPPSSTGDWNNYAKHFDVFVSLTQFFSGVALDYLSDHIQNVAMPHHTPVIVDVAAGTGSCALLAARRFPEARIIATDISGAMIDTMMTKIKNVDISNLEGKVMDGQALDFKDESVDALTCIFGIMFFGDRSRGWKEAHRVLRSGSRASFVTWRTPAVHTVTDEAVLRTAQEIGRGRKAQTEEEGAEGHDTQMETVTSKMVCLSSPDAIANDIRAAGCEFSSVEIHRVPFVWEFFKEAEIENAVQIWTKSPSFNERIKGLEDQVEMVKKKLAEVMRERLNEKGKVAIPTEAFVTVLTK